MREVICSGSPFEIGRQHGTQAKAEIHGSLAFYTDFYQRKSAMDWATASQRAAEFVPMLERDWPEYVEEMKGVAAGSDLPFNTILAMNIRTEISMGMLADGCTSFAWKTDMVSLLAQNWDWEEAQQKNLIHLNIKQGAPKPSISMITEAGIIGKVGLNSAGVGVCLNAILARGVDYDRLPVHLALRATLDSTSRVEAIAKLERAGVAAAVHFLIADGTGATSIEFSHKDLVKLEMQRGRICHSNHFLVEHTEGVKDRRFGPDTLERMARATELMDGAAAESEKGPTVQTMETFLEDEKGYPGAINRATSATSANATLFGVVMELNTKTARSPSWWSRGKDRYKFQANNNNNSSVPKMPHAQKQLEKLVLSKKTEELLRLEHKYCAGGFQPLPAFFVEAKGAKLWDVDGKEYIDFIAMFSAVNTGHCNPKIMAAVMEQMQKVTLINLATHTAGWGPLAARLCHRFGYDKVIAAVSGSEATDTAVKLGRKWGIQRKGIPADATLVLGVGESFHGLTSGVWNLQNPTAKRAGYGLDSKLQTNVNPSTGQTMRWCNVEDVTACLDEHHQRVAAVIIECLHGTHRTENEIRYSRGKTHSPQTTEKRHLLLTLA
ncbi:hypothetical protein CLAIMM_13158 [Cladophialophora immunda]|nr:hypothetical protein CLAIMM_13158 [Cladophialophora immunda]